MVKLINGQGQLGEALKKAKIEGDWTIYHTWDFENKQDLKIQRNCYRKFVKYVDSHPKEKILFISTLSPESSFYLRFKRLAQVYLEANSKNFKILSICGIIGKGVCLKFREKEIKPFGKMQLISLKKVISCIKEILENPDIKGDYGDTVMYRISGTEIPAELVEELILFGKNGKATQ